MNVRRFVTFVASVAAAFGGLRCGSVPAAEPVEADVGDGSEGGTQSTLTSAAACAEGDITWPAGVNTCAGPWRYDWHGGSCYVPTSDPRCAGKPAECLAGWLSCSSWIFGYVPTMSQVSQYVALEVAGQNCEQVCCVREPGGPPCPKPPCEWECYETYESPTSACMRDVSAQIANVRSWVHDAYDSQVSLVPGTLVAQYSGSAHATCSYLLNVPMPATGSGSQCGCAAETKCQVDQCYTPTRIWSALDKPQGSLPPDSQIVGGTRKCLTCEGIGTADDASVQAKYGCLEESRAELDGLSTAPSAFNLEAARALVDRNRQILYELHGERLTTEQRARARALYGSAGAPACGEAPVDPAPPVACLPGLLEAMRGDLLRCQRLEGEHVSANLASFEVFGCAELLEAYTSVPAESDAACEVQGLRDIARATLSALYDKQLAVASSNDPAIRSSLGAHVRQLYLLDAWHAANRAALAVTHPGEPEPQSLAADLSWALGRLWSEFEKRDNVTGLALDALANNNQGALEATAAEAMRRGDLLSRNLVNAAFTPVGVLAPDGVTVNETPLGGAPLLALLGDAFGPLDARLRDLSNFHDFACLFRECRSTPVTSPLGQAHRLLALTERQTELAGALTNTTSDLAGWKVTFANLNTPARRARLDDALADAAGSAELADADPQTLPASALPLARALRESRERFDRFAATGQFEPKSKKLDLGQTEDVRTEVYSVLNTKIAQLEARADQYHQGLVAFTDNLLATNADDADLARLQNLRVQKALAHDALQRDLDGLAASADFEDQRFGDVVGTFREIESGLSQNEYLQVASTPPFFPSGADARYQGGPVDLAALSLGGPALPIAKGQMLSVSATGQWSPTCALRAVEVLDPAGPPGGPTHPNAIKTDDPQEGPALTGPEGYTIQWSNGQHEANSVTNAFGTSAAAGVRVNICTGLPGIASLFIGVSAEACLYAEAGASLSQTSTWQNGTEKSKSASFSSGLRLLTTPFPNMPAGALLAIVEHPSSGAILDVQVVRSPSTAIVPDQDAKVTFVLNDRACAPPEEPRAADRLTVQAHTMTTEGALAPRVLDAMAESLAFVRSFEATYRDQGRLLPAQASLLRTGARQKLDQKLAPVGQSADSLAAAAPALLNLFNALVDRETVRVERAIEMQSVERQRALLRLELASIDSDLAAAGERSKLRKMSQLLALRNVDGALLRADAGDLLAKTRDYLYPVLELWYPKHLATKSQDQAFQANLRALSTEAPIDAGLVPFVDRASTVVSQLLDAFPNAAFGNKPPGAALPLVMVSFPKPSALGGGPFGGTFQSFWRQADPVRSKALWDAIDARQIAPVTVTPDDLYTSGSGQGTLPCTEAVPVVKALKFFFSSTKGTAYPNAPTLNGLSRWLEGLAPSTQSFLTEAGEKRYELAEGSVYKGITGRVMYGKSHEAAQWFNDTSTFTRTIGLSPFGTFLVDFRNINTNWPGSGTTTGPALTDAEELVVVMQIDSKVIAPGVALPGVGVCE